MSDDTISRRAAIEALRTCQTYLFDTRDPDEKISLESAVYELEQLPSAHPELNEWCHDCKEYDTENDCCPRWGQVIRTALEEAKPNRELIEQIRWERDTAIQQLKDLGYGLGEKPEHKTVEWIPCSERLPEDYEEVLVWFEYFRYGYYNRLYQTHGIGDYSSEYDSWMINHESGWSKLRVIAWMPLPEPYKGEQE